MSFSTKLDENIMILKKLLPIDKSFDLETRTLYLGNTAAFFITINGMYREEALNHIFSDLQTSFSDKEENMPDIPHYLQTGIGYAQIELSGDVDHTLHQLLSGLSVLLADGFSLAMILDARNYPTRSIEEPDTEQVTKGSKDGFVETLLYNTNLIRRRIRSPHLTFEVVSVGTDSQTDIALAYMGNLADQALLEKLRAKLEKLQVSTLTMGYKSLEELLLHKKWFHPMPGMHNTQRPDVACSYLSEGHILLLVDNSPSVLILPCSLFQFTQSPADYYSNPLTGCYFRAVRFFCIPLSLFLLPAFYLIAAYYPEFASRYRLLSSTDISFTELTIFVFAAEFLLDLFKYSCAHSASGFSGSLSIIGGLIIGDIAIELQWASTEVLFYAAVTLLATLSLASIEFGNGLRIYRLFLLAGTALFGPWGFVIGSACILLSLSTTPTFGSMSYLWPLLPFNWAALKTLLFRYPTFKAQPTHVWKRR